MKRFGLIIFLIVNVIFCFSLTALAALDQFVGDSAIYNSSTEQCAPDY
jgi:hypothetical protein